VQDDMHGRTHSGRRQFLQAVLSSAVVGVAIQAGIELSTPTVLNAQTSLSPDAALQELLAANQRFAANQLTSIEHDLTILKEHAVSKLSNTALLSSESKLFSCLAIVAAGLSKRR
jgi:hypothetical protein